ncbi:hypothetical protein [Hyphomicrobium sp. D-2]|uniref:hypothetical protein n=1 Tax=Hyphomicrobium sp. D-2 TaxID=3041621 RepID=UPI00245698BD|nr:hypothetical protein [Hyphomicrobium sp. D-2]MDH4982661.1 hypothetical protein [Hyphomicrobium sp. D-2]
MTISILICHFAEPVGLPAWPYNVRQSLMVFIKRAFFALAAMLFTIQVAPTASPPAIAAEKMPPFVTVVSPIFGQLVAFSQPSDFVIGLENVNGSNYIREAIPSGETVEDWTQMVTVTGFKQLALQPQAEPVAITSAIANGYKNFCPDLFAVMPVPPPDVDGFKSFAAVVGCGTVTGNGSPRREETLIIAIEGESDYYTIQWATRGPASDKPPAFDKAAWEKRRADLSPIRLCRIVPGESAPYPSCVRR